MAYQPGGQYQQIYDNRSLTPIPAPQYATNSRFSEQSDTYQPYEEAELRELEQKDSKMKRQIRVLRVVARVLAVVLSIAVVIPLTMTLVKFYQTKDVHATVNGNERRLWPENPNTNYTYIYFGVSVVSLLLNTLILVSYCHGVRQANNAATIGTIWSSIIIAGHVGVWIAAVAIYRYGKQKVDNKWEDLWGWTCSKTADDLQPFAREIKFDKYCTIQDAGYYAGLLQVGLSLLTGFIFILMVIRRRTKKKLKNFPLDDAKEPLRSS